MTDAKPLQAGDPCPSCGGELKAVRAPSDEQFKAAFDRENPGTLPAGVDTAKPADRAALGSLHKCADCGYVTRFKVDEAHDETSGAGAATADDAPTRRGSKTR